MHSLELNGLQELNQEELANSDGGGILDDIAKGLGKYLIKFTWTGFGDGNPKNDEVDLYLLGKKIF
jgi:hypothetical protein